MSPTTAAGWALGISLILHGVARVLATHTIDAQAITDFTAGLSAIFFGHKAEDAKP